MKHHNSSHKHLKKIVYFIISHFFIVYIDKRNYTVGQNGLNIDDVIYL